MLTGSYSSSLVLISLCVAILASYTALDLTGRIATAKGRAAYLWMGGGALAMGIGVWSMHFIGMLAFSLPIDLGYDLALTAFSLLIAVLSSGFALWLVSQPSLPALQLGFGALIMGAGIACMHYTGMAAFEVQGGIQWNPATVLVSIVAGMALAPLAILNTLRANALLANLVSSATMTAAICAHHFIAMSAVSIFPNMTTIPVSSIPTTTLAAIVAAGSLAILIMSGIAICVDLRFRRAGQEAARMLGLANAAVEGLVICEDGRIVHANESALALAGLNAAAIEGHAAADLFMDGKDDAGQARETYLRAADGTGIPVEVIVRGIDYCGRPHEVLAIRDMRERKKAEAEIMRLAHFDPLTGLPNRRSFTAKLEAEMASNVYHAGSCLALVLIDLDRFKEVNDLFGHGVGDALLQRVAGTVSALLQPGQMMARLGGDEFAVVLPGLADPSAAGRFAELMLKALHEADGDSEADTMISASMGIALYPSDAMDRETLMTHADTALYRAKTEGRDTYCFFESEMGTQAHDRRLMEKDLRQAAQSGQFRLVYQPQQDIRSGSVLGFEALLRWDHPTRGEMQPSVFIPVAEDSGSIMQIDEWVLTNACAEAARWPAPLSVAVNISGMQLHNQGFARKLHQILLQSGLSPKRLEIEVTETALIKDMQRALTTLRQVKALGVRVAMDDFGTGNSSLSNLRAFPFDKIKIDASFIKSVDKNAETATIVRAVLGLGRGLGLPVLAEGVETPEELGFLEAEACQIGQGYYLGWPAPIEDFAELPVPAVAPRRVRTGTG